MSEQQPVFQGEIVEEGEWLTLQQMTVLCSVHQERIVALIEEGIVEPRGREPERWLFPPQSLPRARAALRLEYDLGVNLAGVALILELREELERLRARLEIPGHQRSGRT